MPFKSHLIPVQTWDIALHKSSNFSPPSEAQKLNSFFLSVQNEIMTRQPSEAKGKEMAAWYKES